jgi:hypothetical protein
MREMRRLCRGLDAVERALDTPAAINRAPAVVIDAERMREVRMALGKGPRIDNPGGGRAA